MKSAADTMTTSKAVAVKMRSRATWHEGNAKKRVSKLRREKSERAWTRLLPMFSARDGNRTTSRQYCRMACSDAARSKLGFAGATAEPARRRASVDMRPTSRGWPPYVGGLAG